MKAFIKEVSKFGIWYATILELWYCLDCVVGKMPVRRIRNSISRIMDRLEELCNQYDHHLEYPTEMELEYMEERIATPCGCIWSSCDECGVHSVCTQIEDLQEQIGF